LIDFNQPWFQAIVNHDIKAQNLETYLVFEVIWLTSSKNMMKIILSSDYGLDNQILYIFLELGR
jgi:hypothetical protein